MVSCVAAIKYDILTSFSLFYSEKYDWWQDKYNLDGMWTELSGRTLCGGCYAYYEEHGNFKVILTLSVFFTIYYNYYLFAF
jgi:hypothetical protein